MQSLQPFSRQMVRDRSRGGPEVGHSCRSRVTGLNGSSRQNLPFARREIACQLQGEFPLFKVTRELPGSGRSQARKLAQAALASAKLASEERNS